ncbi:hypothetical protein HPB47_015381 [Ixodes persulcatus]|uniref:Uncharacterized protein n=1 Tax=Ixodes persulcatus TaxID=34615 RepID=A0AC60QW81_IXOPE|nr:hypothetical protein HPB47_015381 [Ixodes persulcatus]
MGNQGTLGPPILNPAGCISANSEIEEMKSAVSLTSGTCGPQTPANATQSPTSDVTTIDIQLDTGLLKHLGISKEDVGRLITELLVHYAQGTLNLRSTIPQDVPNEGTATQPTPDCKMVYHPPSNDFPALNDPQGKTNASLGASQATLTEAVEAEKHEQVVRNPTFIDQRQKTDALWGEREVFLQHHVSQLDNWRVSRNKRRRKRATTPTENLDVKASDETEEKTKGQAPTQTVVLKPICREDVKTFGSREIKNDVEKAGITCGQEYRIQIQPKTNRIAITTRNVQTTEKLLKITELNKKDKAYALRPYKALGNIHSRGVIYLNGDASEETPETLLADLECRTAKVVYARLMGKDSNAVVITFQGTRLPKKVVFSGQIFNVKPYRPRPIVCYNCHGLGHMTDVCPCLERRCRCCGYIHEEDMEDCKREPHCRNCNGPHVATSKDCPKCKIPGKKSSQPRQSLRPQRTSYADAIKVVNSTQSKVQVNRCDPSGSQERASPDWVPDWAKIIANENKPKPQPQLTETKEKDTARVAERHATKAELKRIETKLGSYQASPGSSL